MLRQDPFITGEYYHIYNRGIDKRVIFKTRSDFQRFILLLYVCNSTSEKPFRLDNLKNHSHKTYEEILALDKEESLVSIGVWCLMPNHFHILIRQEVDGGITKFMKKIGTGYSMYFNIKYKRTGALFGGLFKSKLVGTDDVYLRQLFSYVHLNALDIKFSSWDKNENKFNQKEMEEFLDSYEYSSYLDYVGINRVENGIINQLAFPEYFQKGQSFKNFMKDFYLYKTKD